MSFMFRISSPLLAALAALLIVISPPLAYACNGLDVELSENPAEEAFKAYRGKEGITYMDAERHLLLESETARVSPGLALSIAERFVRERLSEEQMPLRFRKLERVHRRLVYQFETQPIEGYNGLYHLGPVNFKVERLILDVD
ncbi:MAG: hypothetical protein PVG55_05555, partial [Nitrospirota bacterium]